MASLTICNWILVGVAFVAGGVLAVLAMAALVASRMSID